MLPDDFERRRIVAALKDKKETVSAVVSLSKVEIRPPDQIPRTQRNGETVSCLYASEHYIHRKELIAPSFVFPKRMRAPPVLPPFVNHPQGWQWFV